MGNPFGASSVPLANLVKALVNYGGGDGDKLINGQGTGIPALDKLFSGDNADKLKKELGIKQTPPALAPLQQVVSPEQISGAQSGANNSLGGLQGLLSALQGQNGLGLQTASQQKMGTISNALGSINAPGNTLDSYNAQLGLNDALGDANGIGVQNNAIQGLQGVAGQQAGTLGQLQGIANGTGPNPAQAALNQATAQNVANQSAMMAGQRGAGSNVGLIARLAAQQGANTQQQAVGQSATMQAQQQLGALQQMGAQQQALANTNQIIGSLGGNLSSMQQQGIAQQGNLAQQQVGNQLTANAQEAGQINKIADQQIGTTKDVTGANLQNTQQVQNAAGQQNNSAVQNQSSVNSANAGTNQEAIKGTQQAVGGAFNTLATAFMAEGGVVESSHSSTGPRSSIGQHLLTMHNPAEGFLQAMYSGGLAEGGGAVKAKSTNQVASKSGDSYSNDKIPTLLSEKEIVIPRSITMGKNPVQDSARFVQAILAKRGKR